MDAFVDCAITQELVRAVAVGRALAALTRRRVADLPRIAVAALQAAYTKRALRVAVSGANRTRMLSRTRRNTNVKGHRSSRKANLALIAIAIGLALNTSVQFGIAAGSLFVGAFVVLNAGDTSHGEAAHDETMKSDSRAVELA